MTPKEKADELIKKYTIATWIKLDEIKYLTTIPTAKECALILVDEIMKMPNIGYNHNQDESQYDYWQEVKQEIENI